MNPASRINPVKRSVLVLVAGFGLVIALAPSPSPAIEVCPQDWADVWKSVDYNMDKFVPTWKNRTPYGCIQIIDDW